MTKTATYEITDIVLDDTDCGMLDAIAEYGEDAMTDYVPNRMEVTIKASAKDVFNALLKAVNAELDYPVVYFKYKKI